MPLPPNNTRHRSRWLGAVCSFQSKRGAAAKYPSNHIIRRWVDGRFYEHLPAPRLASRTD